MAVKAQFDPIARQTFDASTLSGTYQTMSAAGLSLDAAVFKMFNGANVDIDISYDGVEDHDILPARGTFILDCGTMGDSRRPAFPKGRQIWVKGTAGVGTVYVSGYTQTRTQ